MINDETQRLSDRGAAKAVKVVKGPLRLVGKVLPGHRGK